MKFFSWQFELQLMMDESQFSNCDVFVVVECLNCGAMASIETFGINGVILGMPVYSSECRKCSSCMDTDTMKYMTSKQN